MIKSLQICHNGDNFMRVRHIAEEIVCYIRVTRSITDDTFFLIMKTEYYSCQHCSVCMLHNLLRNLGIRKKN